MLLNSLKKVISSIFKKRVAEVAFSHKVEVSVEDIKTAIEEWNLNFPIDRWWRRKHSIPFGSKLHNEASLIDMWFEFQEDLLYIEVESSKGYTPNKGEFLKESSKSREITEEEKYQNFLKEAKEIDLSQFDDIKNG